MMSLNIYQLLQLLHTWLKMRILMIHQYCLFNQRLYLMTTVDSKEEDAKEGEAVTELVGPITVIPTCGNAATKTGLQHICVQSTDESVTCGESDVKCSEQMDTIIQYIGRTCDNAEESGSKVQECEEQTANDSRNKVAKSSRKKACSRPRKDSSLLCPYCQFSSPKMASRLLYHIASHGVTCPNCNLLFSGSLPLICHMKAVHNDLWKCSLCGELLTSFITLLQHYNGKHLICRLCLQICRDRSALMHHLNKHRVYYQTDHATDKNSTEDKSRETKVAYNLSSLQKRYEDEALTTSALTASNRQQELVTDLIGLKQTEVPSGSEVGINTQKSVLPHHSTDSNVSTAEHLSHSGHSETCPKQKSPVFNFVCHDGDQFTSKPCSHSAESDGTLKPGSSKSPPGSHKSSSTHDMTPKTYYGCPQCILSTSSLPSLSKHISSHGVHCPACDNIIVGHEAMTKHVQICHENTLKCSYCDAVRRTYTGLLYHLNRQHSVCHLCFIRCTCLADLEKHLKEHETVMPPPAVTSTSAVKPKDPDLSGRYQCHRCPFTARTLWNMPMHIACHGVNCPVCDKFIKGYSALTKHVEKTHGNAWICAYCDVVLTSFYFLLRHYARVHLMCRICLKNCGHAFFMKEHLKDHVVGYKNTSTHASVEAQSICGEEKTLMTSSVSTGLDETTADTACAKVVGETSGKIITELEHVEVTQTSKDGFVYVNDGSKKYLTDNGSSSNTLGDDVYNEQQCSSQSIRYLGDEDRFVLRVVEKTQLKNTSPDGPEKASSEVVYQKPEGFCFPTRPRLSQQNLHAARSVELFKEYQCHSCFFTTTSLDNLQVHKHSHQLCVCETCGKNFTKATINNHIDMVHGGKKFQCCQRSHYNSEHPKLNLKRQLTCCPKQHTTHKKGQVRKIGKKRWLQNNTCTLCDTKFSSYASRRKHIKDIHMGNTQRCKECGIEFKCKSFLDKHMRFHDDCYPLCCEICGKQFRYEQSLRNHIRVTHSQKDFKPYKCAYCSFTSALSGNCRKHVMRRHNGMKVAYTVLKKPA